MRPNRPCEQLFVIGAPRSGTTFLSGLLADTRYGRPLESHFITRYHDRLHRYGDLSEPAAFSRLLRDIGRERAVMQWKLPIDADRLRDEMPENVSFGDIVNRLCLMRRGSPDANAWGDKTPQYTRHVDVIHGIFPDAKFIYIVRDGRDVALSLLKKSWGPHNIYACAVDWAAMNQPSPLLDELEERGQLMCVRYEQLLSDPETHVDALYRFLGERVGEERKRELCASTRGDNAFKWRDAMSLRQVAIFDAVAGPTLRRLGYESSGSDRPLGTLQKLSMRAHDAALTARHLFVVNVVDGFRIRFLGAEPFDR